MKRRFALPLAVLALFGLMTAFASSAQAHPSYAGMCSGCHSGPNIAVTATLANTVGTIATYNVSAPGATAIAVFDGTAKVGSPIIGTAGSFAVAVGKSYTVFAVAGPTTNTGIGSTSVSPVAPIPVPDTTAPATTSDAVATYLNSATINLSSTDNVGGSGVAHAYYILDAGAQTEGTMVGTSVIGAHTLEFWSVDVANNSETPHQTASFTVTAPAPAPGPAPAPAPVPTPVPVADTTAPTTTSDAVATYLNSATINLSSTDNVGGSGVAHTYYILDAGAQTEGTMVGTSVIGAHTLEFWSVDAANNSETPHGRASFDVTVSVAAPTNVYRFYNKNTGSHFYTASEAEKNSVAAELSSTYTLEGVAYTIDTSNPDNNAPLYRFYDKKNGSHFYTASETEKNDLIATMSAEYSYDGPAFSVCETPVAGATAVYRFYNSKNGSHLYTASSAEQVSLMSNLSTTYELDGPAFYLAP